MDLTENFDVEETNVNVAPFPKELADIVSKLHYRPGWRFNLIPNHDRGQGSVGLTFVVVSQGYDSYNPERGETYRVQHFFPVPAASFNRSSWMRWVFEQLLSIENHETGEFMVVDGERPFAPIHAPGYDPYVVREMADPEAVRTTFRGDEHDDLHELVDKVAERIAEEQEKAGVEDGYEPLHREEIRKVVERTLRGE